MSLCGAVLAAATSMLLLLAPAPASAAGLEAIGDFDEPVYVASDPADAGRLLVAERSGMIFEVRGGEQTVWADLGNLVLCCEGERGLLSIVPAPDFHANDRIYVAYSGEAAAGGEAGDIHVDSFRHGDGGLVREPILAVPHSADPSQYGGQVAFGPEGALYAAFGDGGGGGGPLDNAQNLESLLGKLIRIYPYPGNTPTYVIPGDNPFTEKAAFDEIWSYGLRDPWRFSFDRLSGDMVIADRGESAREEIDLAPRLVGAPTGGGANYGWDCREGSIAYGGEPSPICKERFGLIDPVFDYPDEDPGDGSAHGCAITGGYVVRDPSVPDLDGRYLYGDLCTGAVRSIALNVASPASTDRAEPALGVTPSTLTSFGEDSCGRVYVVTRTGPVYRVVGEQPNRCGLAATAPPTKAGARRRPEVGLRVRRPGRDPEVVRIDARVRPCVENRRRRLILERDGRRSATELIKGRCVVRFRTRVARRASFRALLPLGRGAGTVRSRRAVVRAPAG